MIDQTGIAALNAESGNLFLSIRDQRVSLETQLQIAGSDNADNINVAIVMRNQELQQAQILSLQNYIQTTIVPEVNYLNNYVNILAQQDSTRSQNIPIDTPNAPPIEIDTTSRTNPSWIAAIMAKHWVKWLLTVLGVVVVIVLGSCVACGLFVFAANHGYVVLK